MDNGMMNFDYMLLLWEIIALFLFSLLFFVGFFCFLLFFRCLDHFPSYVFFLENQNHNKN